jgi:5-methylcytosine-specific restriction protein A
MLLDWGNVLQFDDETKYYETLGFLSKDEEYIKIYIENNNKAGAWAAQGRMSLRNVDIDSLPESLMKAFLTSTDGRISETRYVKNLKENHCFTREIDPTGSNFTKRLSKQFQKNMWLIFLEDIIGTVLWWGVYARNLRMK